MPEQEAVVAVELVPVQVRIAPFTICVAVKKPTGGKSRLGPGGPGGPAGTEAAIVTVWPEGVIVMLAPAAMVTSPGMESSDVTSPVKGESPITSMMRSVLDTPARKLACPTAPTVTTAAFATT